jgi:shikimate dehydrogenase
MISTMIDRQTQIYGVIGYPLGHTLSPVMHNAAFKAVGLNACYLAFETRDLPGALAGMKARGVRGLSVTIPYKTAVVPLLDEVDDLAGKIGAVNTIINQQGRLIGFNTDALGALKALREKTQLAGKTGLMVGAGGAARAIGFLLKEQGVCLTLTNRSREKGEALADFLNCLFLPLEEINRVEADLLVQTTPVGMVPHEDQCLLGPQNLKKGMIVMDVIYNPLETRLLRMARDLGCTAINGLPMFIHQGAEQFRRWTGLHPPLAEMTQAVGTALGGFR